MTPSSATGSASSSTPAAAGSSRSSTARTSTTEGPALRVAVRGPGAVGLDGRGMLSMEWSLTGPVITQVAACATSVIAFHDALRLIQTGECDVVLTGGSRRRSGRWASPRSPT